MTRIIPDPAFRSIFFRAPADSSAAEFPTMGVTASGSGRMSFWATVEFVQLVSAVLVGVPSAGAAGAARDIDLYTSYGSPGERCDQHEEEDTSTTYDLTGESGNLVELDIAPLLSSLQPGDLVGLRVAHNAVGGTIDYLGVVLRYSTA